MPNINKYWVIMETLHFPILGVPKKVNLTEDQRIQANLKLLKDKLKISPEDIFLNMIKDETLQHFQLKRQNIFENADDSFIYCLYSLQMLLEIHESASFMSDTKEDLISEKHKSLIISSIVDVASIVLQKNMHASFYKEKGAIFTKPTEMVSNLYRLEFIVEMVSPLMHIKSLHIGKSLADVQLWYMGSIFSLFIAFDAGDYHLEQTRITLLYAKLQKMWCELSKKLYYRNLMLLYSGLPITQRQRIHKEMILRLCCPGGFVALLFAITESHRREGEQSVDLVVSNLVAQPCLSIKAQHSLIKQVLQFLKASLKNTDYSAFIGAGLLSLKKLHSNKTENKEFIKDWLEKEMKPLIQIETSHIIAMEWLNFVDLISLLFHIFCISSVATLPSGILVAYLPVFLELHRQIECYANQKTLRNHLQSLILKILNNRSRKELQEIIEYVTLESYPKNWFQLSSSIHIKENSLNMQELKLSIVDKDAAPLDMSNKSSLTTLVTILKNSSFHLLSYQHFVILLQLMPSIIIVENSQLTSNTNTDLLDSVDIYNKILVDYSQIYEMKLQIIKALESLVQHQPLKALINDNIKDLLKVLEEILSKFTESFSKGNLAMETNSTVLLILLILIREIIENCSINVQDLQKNLLKPLTLLESATHNENLRYQINCLLKVIRGEVPSRKMHCEAPKNDFDEARTFIESNKPYLQVEGIENMIKLLSRRDAFTVSNVHILTALALNTLKSPESYTFLNCVRLFVALVNVNESEVLDLLSDEYLNEEASMDYRLIIGEAILKTSKELGPLCYKYKSILLNTFMIGCRSPVDEFRFSTYSNLSQMCRQLTYQVHNYFQELLHLIDCELTTGMYFPAKRAAVMVLSDLLSGMDNLFDYEEMLLPIYRLLKHLVMSEKTEEKTRVHASNGLKTLSEKCKALFQTTLEQHQQGKQLEKSIQIMGIHDSPKKNTKSYILEIN